MLCNVLKNKLSFCYQALVIFQLSFPYRGEAHYDLQREIPVISTYFFFTISHLRYSTE